MHKIRFVYYIGLRCLRVVHTSAVPRTGDTVMLWGGVDPKTYVVDRVVWSYDEASELEVNVYLRDNKE